jgi:hypothetical protein
VDYLAIAHHMLGIHLYNHHLFDESSSTPTCSQWVSFLPSNQQIQPKYDHNPLLTGKISASTSHHHHHHHHHPDIIS